MSYVIDGLDSGPFEPYFAMSDEELAAQGAVRMTVNAAPGFPCRVTLEDIGLGESVILINHVSRDGATPYRASYAIFVSESAGNPARFENAVPPVFETRALSMRGFDADGMMVEALLTEPGDAERGLARLFDNERIDEIDVHNAVRGCFSARARRG